MRLFIGVPLPAAARDAASRVLRQLKSHEWPVRWVRDESLHVTLKFFGEVTSDRVDAIAEMLAFATKDMKPMVLAMRGIGVFPALQRPRVLHLDLEAGADLELLQDRIERGGDRLGFSPEGRPFRPHVTLGRVKEGQRLPSGWHQALERLPLGHSFIADRVVLYESRLLEGRPAYSAFSEVALT
jgi:2'-5' RNA ligase